MKSFACILLVALAATAINADEPERLHGGKDVSITKYPHVVSIQVKGDHKCGGAIISPYHVITAAHCVQAFMAPEIKKTITIVTGTANLKFGGKAYAVAEMFFHPKFNASPKQWAGYDVGIYKLAEPIQTNTRSLPIALPSSNIPEDVEVTVAGWGATESGFNSDKLRELTVYTMGVEECREMDMKRVQDNEFCTLVMPGFGTCQGDSGSAVTYEGEIVGVVSYGIPCAIGYPDVHTNLFMVRDWIDSILAQ